MRREGRKCCAKLDQSSQRKSVDMASRVCMLCKLIDNSLFFGSVYHQHRFAMFLFYGIHLITRKSITSLLRRCLKTRLAQSYSDAKPVSKYTVYNREIPPRCRILRCTILGLPSAVVLVVALVLFAFLTNLTNSTLAS